MDSGKRRYQTGSICIGAVSQKMVKKEMNEETENSEQEVSE